MLDVARFGEMNIYFIEAEKDMILWFGRRVSVLGMALRVLLPRDRAERDYWVRRCGRLWRELNKVVYPYNFVFIPKPKKVVFPLFEIASSPEIRLEEFKSRRFDLVPKRD